MICGLRVRYENFQRRLLIVKKLTFQVASETPVAMELAYQSELAFRTPPTTATSITIDTVHTVNSASKHGGRKDLTGWRKIILQESRMLSLWQSP